MRHIGVIAVVGIALTGCAGDPREAGITGPHPDGVTAITLTQASARADVMADHPGIGGEVLNQYVPTLRPRTDVGSGGQRYFGYNY